jgi:hypothetical protein
VVCPILEFREEKRTFAKVEGGKVDFFPRRMEPIYEPIQQEFLSAHIYVILLRLNTNGYQVFGQGQISALPVN